MRSASMPLFGFDETRISLSRSDTQRILCLAQGPEASGEALPEVWRRGVAAEALADEEAQAAMDADALFALGADADVDLEVDLFALAEVSVEEEVSNPFHIVTDHYCGLLGHRGDDSATVRNS